MTVALPAKVQQGAFGTRSGAPAGGSLQSGRVAPPRPALIQRGTAQGREHFVTTDGKIDPVAIGYAINELQVKVRESTAQTRANPMADGLFFQNVPISGPLVTGTSSQAPNTTDATIGYPYFDTTLGKPLWFSGGNWVTATGAVQYAGTAGSMTLTSIEHGFGAPAVGLLITNVSNGLLRAAPQIILAGNSSDNSIVRFWVPIYQNVGKQLTADVYVFR